MNCKIAKHDFISIIESNPGLKLREYQALFKSKLDVDINLSSIYSRVAHYRKTGDLPLPSGNSVPQGEILQGSSTLYDSDGSVKLQWVKTNVAVQQQLDSIKSAVESITDSITPITPVPVPETTLADLATVYISNDLHIGALMWEPESGTDWNTSIAESVVHQSYNYLFDTSPNSKIGVIVDLGDLTETDDFTNQTPKSGNNLSVDSRFPKILRVAYQSLIYAITLALQKHELVYFYNIAGNHDLVTAHAVREIISAWFRDEPRVIVDQSPSPIKYMQHGKTLLQFVHGDGLKMKDAGEVMAFDMKPVFSETEFRYSHFGHTHVDSVHDGRLCRVESHRNLPPTNHWAHHMGYRSPPGTMKSITYSTNSGEISRNIYTIPAQ